MLDQLFLGQFLSLLCELLKNGAPLCLSLCSQARPQDLAEVKEEREGEITKEANMYEHPRVLFLAHYTDHSPMGGIPVTSTSCKTKTTVTHLVSEAQDPIQADWVWSTAFLVWRPSNLFCKG